MQKREHGVWTHVIALAIVVLVAVGARVAMAPLHEPLTHDESISVMHAAGKSVEYNALLKKHEPPFGTWSTFGTYQRFLTFDGVDLGAVREAVTKADQHPPAYFMAVNLWQGAFGGSRDAGWLVNLVTAAISAMGLYGIGYALTKNPLVAALGSCVYGVMPGAIETSLTIRQYDMLAMFSVLLVWRAIVVGESDKPLSIGEAAIMAALSVGGLMSHLYFVLPMAGVWLWLAYKTLRTERRTLVVLTIALALGLGVAMLLNADSFDVGGKAARPGVKTTVGLALEKGVAFTRVLVRGSGVSDATVRNVRDIGTGLGLPKWPATGLALALFVAVIAVVVAFRSNRESFMRALRQSAPIWFFFGWLTVTVGAMYMVIPGLSPALGLRYLAMSWPFLGLGLGVVASGLTRQEWLAPALLVAALSLNIVYSVGFEPRFSAPELTTARHVVIDDPARGVLLPYADVAPSGTEVFAAWRADLVGSPSAWLDRLQPGDLVILDMLYQPKKLPESDVIDLVKARWKVEKLEKFPGLRGTPYLIAAPSQTATPNAQ